jgi:hypothetical protein
MEVCFVKTFITNYYKNLFCRDDSEIFLKEHDCNDNAS